MNKNILIGIGVALVILIGGFYFFNISKSKTPSQSAASGAVAGAPTKEFNVSAKEYAFTPSALSASKGDNVKINFTNNGTTAHNFTITDLNVATKTISPGESDSITFNVPNSGDFTYFCSIDGHKGFGMQGRLEVR